MRRTDLAGPIRAIVSSVAMILSCAAAAIPEDLPRTLAGRPDFSGTWDYGSLTPLERPDAFAGKPHFTPEEAREFVAHFDRWVEGFFRGLEGDGGFVGVDSWLNFGNGVEPDLRTSRVVDPSDGRIPRTAETNQRRAAFFERRRSYSDPEVLLLTERCLADVVPLLRAPDGNFVRIVQTPDFLVVAKEFPQTRIIPISDAPHLPAHIRSWEGDSRARWDGDTLVVDTRNVRAENSLEGAGPNMVLTERFSLSEKDQIRYEFTVEDPEAFSAPWTVLTYIHRTNLPRYDYSCHEGNRSMIGILKGSRLLEREAEAKGSH